jgi:hypothetical protein
MQCRFSNSTRTLRELPVDDATTLSWIERVFDICFLWLRSGVTGEFVGNWIAGPIRKRLEAAKELEIARLNKEEVAETSS